MDRPNRPIPTNKAVFVFTRNLPFSFSHFQRMDGLSPRPGTHLVNSVSRSACACSRERLAIGPLSKDRELKTEDEQHRLITHLPELRRHRVDVSSIPVKSRLDCEILPTADSEGHWRSVDAAANIELPEFLQTGVVVGHHRAIREAGYQEAARGRESRAVVGIRDVQFLPDLAGKWVCDADVCFVPVDVSARGAIKLSGGVLSVVLGQ